MMRSSLLTIERAEVENRNPLTPFKFHAPIFASLADDAVHFGHAVLMNEVENRFMGERVTNTFLAHIIIRTKQISHTVNILGAIAITTSMSRVMRGCA